MEKELADALRGILRLVKSEPDPRHGEYRMRFSVRATDFFAAKEALEKYDVAKRNRRD